MSILTQQERKKFFSLTLLNTIIALVDILFLVLLLLIVNYFIQPSFELPFFLSGLSGNTQSAFLIILFLVLFTLKSIVAIFVQQFQYRFAFRTATRLAEKGLLHFYNSGFNNHSTVDSSVFIKKIGQWPIEFCLYVLAGLHQAISQALLVVFTATGILLFNSTLFITLFALLLPPLVLTAYISKRHLRKAKINTKTNSEKAQQKLQEALNGFVESNIYRSNNFFVSRYGKFQAALNNDLATLQTIQAIPSRLIEIFTVSGLFLLIGIVKWAGISNPDYLIILGAFMGAAYKIIPGIVRIININGQINAYRFAVEDILHTNQQATADEHKMKITEELNSVQFKNVRFNYDKTPVLDNLSFNIEKGDFFILAGESGKGKTTALNILTGFLLPTSGEIRLNNRLVTNEELINYRSRIAYVKQQPFLIHDTLLRNIILADADYNVERLRCAIEMSGCDRLIETSLDDLNKTITENGKNISGGQRQRIALARALYKNPDLIILDEPFAELDEEAEWELLTNLKTLSQAGKMIVLVTHNSNSLSFSNKNVSLDAE